MSIELIKEYLLFKTFKKEMMNNLNEISEKIELLEGKCIEYMINEGIQSINVDGSKVSIKNQYFANYSKIDEAINELAKSELSWMLKQRIDDRTLASHIREMIANSEIESSKDIKDCIELPETIKEYISIYEKTTLSVRKS